jgi:hypothetical protein
MWTQMFVCMHALRIMETDIGLQPGTSQVYDKHYVSITLQFYTYYFIKVINLTV